jgi:hypothetical protein
MYQVARSSRADFTDNCTLVTTPDTYWFDGERPGAGSVFYYMVRALDPNTGSWGTGTGAPRSLSCTDEDHALVFRDTAQDNLPADSLLDLFSGIPANSNDHIFIEIRSPYYGSPDFQIARCMERADWYIETYVNNAVGNHTVFSEGWSKWWIPFGAGGQWSGPDNSPLANDYGFNCFEDFSWCVEPELAAVLGQDFPAVRPGDSQGCESYESLFFGCGDSFWQMTIKVGRDRLSACGF